MTASPKTRQGTPSSSKKAKRKRVVILVGPHKSASSTVQEFFVQYATGRKKYRKVSAFQEWRWPVVPNSKVPTRKQLAQLVVQQQEDATASNTSIIESLHQTILETVEKYPNMILGTEEFDRIGDTPWSHRDGIAAIQNLPLSWSDVSVDFVVNYRQPRAKQWISIWKQLTAMDQLNNNKNNNPKQKKANGGGGGANNYFDWICQADPLRLWEYLDSVANPLRLAQTLLQHFDNLHKVYLIDMGGILERQLDIAHITACQVLQLPCDANREWVRGIQNRTLVFNVKASSSTTGGGISSDANNNNYPKWQEDEMEWLFRQRDCAYQTYLQSQVQRERMEILTPSLSLWKDCSAHAEEVVSNQLLNTTLFLQLLQSQGTCRGQQQFSVLEWKKQMTVKKDGSTLVFQSQPESTPPGVPTQEQFAVQQLETSGDWVLIQIIQWALVTLLFASFFQKKLRRCRLNDNSRASRND